MGMPRSYTDDQLRLAVKGATSWSDVMEALGKPRKQPATRVKEFVAQLGLDTSHFVNRSSSAPVRAMAHDFPRRETPSGRTGLSVAARWFLDRGYTVSVPLEPTAYDLITESADGLKRVQVKTTSHKESSGRFNVRLSRMIYDPTARRNAAGSYRAVPYSPGTVDLFFVATQTGDLYLVPFDALDGRISIVLDDKWSAFKVA
jgi:hypothetical protein